MPPFHFLDAGPSSIAADCRPLLSPILSGEARGLCPLPARLHCSLSGSVSPTHCTPWKCEGGERRKYSQWSRGLVPPTLVDSMNKDSPQYSKSDSVTRRSLSFAFSLPFVFLWKLWPFNGIVCSPIQFKAETIGVRRRSSSSD